ncbi:hypothetical protein MRX96_036881 [Rhipicephalus microplus]
MLIERALYFRGIRRRLKQHHGSHSQCHLADSGPPPSPSSAQPPPLIFGRSPILIFSVHEEAVATSPPLHPRHPRTRPPLHYMYYMCPQGSSSTMFSKQARQARLASRAASH